MFAKFGFRRVYLPLVAVGMLIAVSVGVTAQSGGVPDDAQPGDAVGFSGAVLGAIDPSVTQDYRLALARSVFEPGAYVTSHIHPTAIVVCVQEGSLGFAIQHGSATITRAAGPGTPSPTEPLTVGTDSVLEPNDCVAFDHFAAHTSHTGWNASDDTTIIWEARLLKIDEPFTVFVDSEGNPVP